MAKLGRYIKILKPFRAQVIGYLLLLVCSCACDLMQPVLMGRAVTQLNALIAGTGGLNALLATVGIMAGTAAVALGLALGAVKLSVVLSCGFTAALRADIFEHACSMSAADIGRIGVTAMLDRSTYDILGLMDFLSLAMRAAVTVPVYSVVGCVMAFRIDGYSAALMTVCIPLVIVLVAVVTRIVRPLQKRSNLYLDKQNAIVHERLSGIRVIRAFNREPYEHDRMAKATNIMADNFVKTNVTMSVASPIMTLMINLVFVLVLYLGGARLAASSVTAANDVVRLLQYISLITNALFSSAWAVMSFPRVRVSVARMNEIYDCPEIARSAGDAVADGTVTAADLTYRYADGAADALLPLSFEIAAGERVALIGGTGSGKSTLLSLVSGIDRPTGGTLCVGGTPCDELTVDDMSRNVTVVFQKSDFFTATLRENIDPFGTCSDERIFAALDAAELGEFARGTGLDYRIEQGGSNLSGGQKQRLALARAFVRDTPIYIFDDSFSALDYLTEKRVRKNMSEVLAGKTCIIATQRVSTAIGCDRILLFDGGRLVACGTHVQLMDNALYKEIYVSQTGGAL